MILNRKNISYLDYIVYCGFYLQQMSTLLQYGMAAVADVHDPASGASLDPASGGSLDPASAGSLV